MPKYFVWYGVIVIAAAVAAMMLGAPASTVLVALALLGCPAMMFFMMGSHRGGHAADHSTGGTDSGDQSHGQ